MKNTRRNGKTNDLTSRQENLLITLASDALHPIALFGYDAASRQHIHSLAKTCLSQYFRQKRGRLDEAGLKTALSALPAPALMNRLSVYEHNPYYHWQVFRQPLPTDDVAVWPEISRLAVQLYQLDNLPLPPDENLLAALCKNGSDWWSGNILEDAVARAMETDSEWDGQLAEFLEHKDALEHIARCVFAHPPALSFLYRWCSNMGIADYLRVKQYLLDTLQTAGTANGIQTTPPSPNAFLFF